MSLLKACVRLLVALSLIGALVCCGEIDHVEYRAQDMNKSAATYYSEAILLNLIRASRSEPLMFVSLSGLVGHNTVQGNLGLPSVTIGPHTPVVPPAVVPARNYTFGPNTLSRIASNDFNANVVDDPLAYAGLLAPINPSTIGFFINQGYSRELLFYLFVDRIKVLDARGFASADYENILPPGKNADGPQGQQYDAFELENYECFQNYIEFMIREGFTSQVDADALPSARTAPASRFCADPGLSVWFRPSSPTQYCKGFLSEQGGSDAFLAKPKLGRLTPLCNKRTAWTIAKIDNGSSSSSSAKAADTKSDASATATASGDSPLKVSISRNSKDDLNKPKDANLFGATATSTGKTVSVTVSAPSEKPKESDKDYLRDPCTGMPTTQKVEDPRPGYDFCLNGRTRVQLFLRSAFGVYRFLGKMLARDGDVGLYTGLDSDLRLFQITPTLGDCFVSTIYEGQAYCVPNSASNTKQIFALLRQVVGLNTPIANQPSTLTVRTTP